MVGEFPELQGIMGGYYARNDGLSEVLAEAVEDHYKPRFAGDQLPRSTLGSIAALADKLETLVGMFGTGNLPTGDKDPYALRRHALGVLRILMEKKIPIDFQRLLALGLDGWLNAARTQQVSTLVGVEESLPVFFYERLAASLREQGYSAQEVDAVLALRPQRLAEVGQRLAAVRAFAALPEAESLAAANKRIANILKKVEVPVEACVDEALLKESAEQHLATALKNVQPIADSLFHAGQYEASLRELAMLKGPVDAFFDGVMVNAEDAALRANRLGLLKTLHEAMNRVADLSRLAS
jgi:glycyl-tRNA synthetase beta chain